MKTVNLKDVVIIGGGPAGIAAAVQLKLYGVDPFVVEKGEVGGLLINANFVENYPGFPDGIEGVSLIKLFKKQIKNWRIKIHKGNVNELSYGDGSFHIVIDDTEIRARIVVIASGTKPKIISILENDKECKILYEISPLFGIFAKHMAIIGAGDAAFDYALNLSERNNVTILNRNNVVKCRVALYERAMKSSRIEYLKNIEVTGLGKNNAGYELVCGDKKGEKKIAIDHLVVAIGREPNLDFLSPDLKANLEALKRDKLLYVIGDVNNDIYRQLGICVGDGIKAAMEIAEKLKGQDRCGY